MKKTKAKHFKRWHGVMLSVWKAITNRYEMYHGVYAAPVKGKESEGTNAD